VVEKDEMKEVWRGYYERLMNEEFDWSREGLGEVGEEGGGEVWRSDKIIFRDEEVREAIRRMKEEKAAGPTGVVAEMFKAMGEDGVRRMTELCNEVVREGKIPEDWSRSWMVSIYKGKGDALECGSYRGVKLLEHGLKVFERVVEARLRRNIMEGRICIDDMHFGFMPGRGTTDAVFVVRQVQEKYLQKRRELWMAFVDLEKAFDRVPREVLWWALRRLGVEGGMIRLIKAMYAGSTTAVKVQGEGTESFEVRVGVHQGSVLSPLLFVMVMEALSRDCREGLPFELLYADDLVLMAESREELAGKLGVWKKSLEAKGLRVNISKTKIMKCKAGIEHHMADSAKDPCGVCGRRVGANSARCGQCQKWVHKRCTGIKGKLKWDPQFKCPKCVMGTQAGGVGEEREELVIDGGQGGVVEGVNKFCYLGDMIGAGGGAGDASVARVRCAWAKFNELGPILKRRGASLRLKGKIYRVCVQKVLIYGSETWAMKREDMQRLDRTEMMMVRWMCGVSLKARNRSVDLRERLGITGVAEVVERGRLRWFGHLERKHEGDMISACRRLIVEGKRRVGRPVKTWEEDVKNTIEEWGLKKETAKDRALWKHGTYGKPSNPRKRGKLT
jgi:hypothetical protein